MRALIIMCEPQYLDAIRVELYRHAHSRLIPAMATAIPFDLNLGRPIDGQAVLIGSLRTVPAHTTARPLVLAQREVSDRLRLVDICKGTDAELEISSAKLMTRPYSGAHSALLQQRVIACGLSMADAAASMLQQWTHGQVGSERVKAWLDQFGRLGGHAWIGKALLGVFNLTAPSDLSELLCGFQVDEDEALCVNREPRGMFKSAEVLGNTLNKRFGRTIYPAPADAIQEGNASRIVLFEDGLWSGTEAVGILDSLLGARDDRLKTKRLDDPQRLKQTGVRMVYGIATDYGQAMVRRALTDRQLGHVLIASAQQVDVAEPALLAQMADTEFDMAALLDVGPKPAQLRPYVFEALRSAGLPATDVQKVRDFCQAVGFQLFGNYLQEMCKSKGWDMWSHEKHSHAALGMHGLGLAHAFGHSIPKASLPLFWAGGKVELDGKSVIWQPLLPNS